MSYANPDALVASAWLADHLTAPDVRVVDASWYLPAQGRDPLAEYREAHIPGAVYFDIDDIADTDSALPHMLPAPEKFASRVRRLGLGDGHRIVVYDGDGLFSAARVWWMFRVFGHDDVAILDGGLPKWRAERRRTESTLPIHKERHFTAKRNAAMVRDLKQMRANLDSGREQVLDARSAARFRAEEPEPRQGLRGGHIPGSLCLPHAALVDPDDKTMLPADNLRDAFAAAGIDLGKPVVTTCGSGVTAAVPLLGLHLLGHRELALYDGSWSEWGGRDDTPIET